MGRILDFVQKARDDLEEKIMSRETQEQNSRGATELNGKHIRPVR
jgi:hypothetical protein